MIASIAEAGQRTASAPFGHALSKLAAENPAIVGLSADLAKYTDMHIFAQNHPERFFQMGMAEALMLGAAAGMAEVGLIPFASTYSVFATRRAYDFLCLDIAEPNLNVNVVGALPGLTTGYGPSHQAAEDLALLRAMPNLTIVDPCDSVDIEQAVPQLAATDGPTYLRLLRGHVPTVLDEYDYTFQLGKAAELRTGRDVSFISTGLMTMRALAAAETARSRRGRRRGHPRPDHQTAGPRRDRPRRRRRPARRHPGKPHHHRRSRRRGRVQPDVRRRHPDRPHHPPDRAARRIPRHRCTAHPARQVRAVHRRHREIRPRLARLKPSVQERERARTVSARDRCVGEAAVGQP